MTYDIQFMDEGCWVTVDQCLTEKEAQETIPIINDLLFDADPESPLILRIVENVKVFEDESTFSGINNRI